MILVAPYEPLKCLGSFLIAAYSCLVAAYTLYASAAHHVFVADLLIGSFYSSVCHNSLFSCLVYLL